MFGKHCWYGVTVFLVLLYLFPGTLMAQEDFSQEERAWLEANPVIRVGFDAKWPPFSFRDSQGNFVGVDLDYFALIREHLPVEVEFVTDYDWPTLLEKAIEGEIHVLFSTALTTERVEHLLFTEVYFPVTTAIITREDQPFLLSLESVRSQIFAIPNQYAMHDRLREKFPESRILTPESYAEALRMVAGGEADVSVCNIATASYLIRTLGLENLKISGLAPFHKDLRYAVSREHPELVALLNRAIASVAESDKQAILSRWIHMTYEDFILWHRIQGRVYAIVGGILILFALGVLFSCLQRREIRRRRRAEVELREANARLEAINRDKNDIMHMVAHDLRSPITTLILSAEALKLGDGQEYRLERIHRTADRILHQATRVNHLVNQLVEINTLEEGRFVFSPKPLEVGQWLRIAVQQAENAALQKRINLNLDLPVEPLIAHLDKDPLQQIFDNLLSNAIKFSPPDKTVAIRMVRDGDRVKVSFTDEGPGIPADEQPRLFQKFCCLSPRPTGDETSTGLGLSIVKFLVGGMGGTVEYRDAPQGGAIFEVCFALWESHPVPSGSG